MISIRIPQNVTIQIGKKYIKIQGPFGTCVKKKETIELFKYKNKLYLLNSKNNFYLSLILQSMLGVSKRFCKKLKIIGVGYKVNLVDDKLIFRLGFSHEIIYKIPKTIEVHNPKPDMLIILGNNWHLVTQTAAEIRLLRPPEPYKGKGIRYMDEVVLQKEGKKT